ncbi:hypothetical protein, partial [Salmonella sp. SAL4457]|uniref:hypothetical protein n=1 Tax=Salmonella sp. SAL4457 TaxID=3159912 RepID=UPI00397D58C3
SVLSFLLFISCQKNASLPDSPEAGFQSDRKRTCASQEVLEAQMAADPSLRERLRQIEEFTQRKIASGDALRVNAQNQVEIPVVVHVLYHT